MENDATKDDVVLVTGAASGIGRAIATTLAEDHTVYATDIDTESLEDSAYRGCEVRRLDVRDELDIDETLAEIRRETAGLDCLVNNAGFGELGPVEDVSVDAVRDQFDVNVHGPLRLCQAALPDLRERGGRIVSLSSILGQISPPGMGAYAASKFALEGLHDALRCEVADTDVEVVLIEPAWVETDFADASREQLANREQTETYENLYRTLLRTPAIDGGPLAVSPDRVAEVVLEAVTASEPQTRYGVGWQSQLIGTLGKLPDPLRDRMLAGMVSLSGRMVGD
jgi:NAD(P)-dependent dehydrogenase (short-subunit alcohol dehydrogenase family)